MSCLIAGVSLVLSVRGAGAGRDESPLNFEGGPVTVFATVVSEVEVPDPSASAYPDALVRVAVNVAEDGPAAEGAVIGYAFHERRLSPMGLVRKGDRLKLTLEPWENVSGYYQRFRQIDTAPERFDLPQWWVSYASIVGETTDAGTVARERARAAAAEREQGRIGLERQIIREALRAKSSLLTGGVLNEFFFYGQRGHYLEDFWKDGRWEPGTGPVEVIRAFDQALKERRVALKVVVVPVKSTLYPDIATNTLYAPEIHGPVNTPVGAMLECLAGEHEVDAVPLSERFLAQRWFEHGGETFPLFRPNDTHWAPAGARLAAGEIAEEIRADFSGTFSASPESRFSEETQLEELESDIAEMLRLKYAYHEVRVTPHETPAFRVVGEDAEAAGWLTEMEHPAARVHLIGDSFAEKLFADRSGLHAHLTRELSEPVHLMYRYGGPTDVARDWWEGFAGGPLPRVVVWVFSERWLSVPALWPAVSFETE